jgi:hypothetical protein
MLRRRRSHFHTDGLMPAAPIKLDIASSPLTVVPA